jgi:hypothetical protein
MGITGGAGTAAASTGVAATAGFRDGDADVVFFEGLDGNRPVLYAARLLTETIAIEIIATTTYRFLKFLTSGGLLCARMRVGETPLPLLGSELSFEKRSARRLILSAGCWSLEFPQWMVSISFETRNKANLVSKYHGKIAEAKQSVNDSVSRILPPIA